MKNIIYVKLAFQLYNITTKNVKKFVKQMKNIIQKLKNV